MTTKNTGGSAFPASEEYWGSDCAGMSLRDWFAGQNVAAIIGGLISAKIDTGPDDADQIARLGYAIADAMLAARGADQ